MIVSAYYNEHDEFAAQWLRNLIAAKHIAPGDVDTRSIREVQPDDLRGYTQAHFFAGIGIWSHALRAAGWADDRQVWTGSCPCQPFSAAGKRKGTDDDRHLWPEFYRLVAQRTPDTVFGEQVASKDGLAWLEGVQADLERAGYAVGAVDTCAAGFADEAGNEGFHIRQRLYWGAKRLGNPDDVGPQGWLIGWNGSDQRAAGPSGMAGEAGRLEHPDGAGPQPRAWNCSPTGYRPPAAAAGRLDHTQGDGRLGRQDDGDTGRGQRPSGQAGEADGVAHPSNVECKHGARHSAVRRADYEQAPTPERLSPDRNVDWLYCRDGKYRPVESGTFPLAHEDTQRVGRLRAYGNALDAAQARGFVEAWLDCCPN